MNWERIRRDTEQDYVGVGVRVRRVCSGNPRASSIKKEFGDKITKPFYLNRLSGILSRNNKLDKAIIIAELNIELFPKDSNIWDSLGQIYYANGNKTKALNAYKKALALDSENSYAQEMVKKLEE